MNPKAELPTIAFASSTAWEAWLDENHSRADGVWVKIAKAATGIPTVAYPEVLDVALCFGWIDGQRLRLDQQYFLQKFTPRRPKSIWSKINRDKALALIEAGRMRPAGLRQVEMARADGRLDAAYAGQRTALIPDDLQRELNANPIARTFFEGLDSRNRYAILFRLEGAKRPETRAARLQKFVEMLARHEKVYP